MKKPAQMIIFDIQRFSLHDGPGVRTTIFFKGCTLACLWCQNPESHKMAPEMAFYAEQCLGCFKCEKVCPSKAILPDAEKRIDRSICNACGLCVEVCPSGAIRLIGKMWSVQELAEEVSRDADFFTESGGGITLSGGEPMLHGNFTSELCLMLKKQNLHIVMETAGNVKPELYDSISSLIDLYYYDIKHTDRNKHRALTGADNDLIIRNFIHLAETGCNVQPRMPVIPGTNDDEINIRSTARLIRGAGLSSIHCLPWHALGNSKLIRINSTSRPFEATVKDKDYMERVKNIFNEEDIDAIIYQ
jgi:pyruvate formate lyase activating enzyme